MLKIVLETKHYLHKINKTPLKIHEYIKKTCLKENQTKLKKISDLYTIYNTNCKKNTTIREDFTTFQSIIAKFRVSTQMDNSRLPRRTYLITYSQADLLKFPSRKQYGKCIKTHFNKGSGKVKVQHWACSLEKHQNGRNHYHVALKLTGPKRLEVCKRQHHIIRRNCGQFLRST